MTIKVKYAVYIFIILFIGLTALLQQCEGNAEPVVTETKIKTIIKTDTITKTLIKEVPKTVYIEKTTKGKDSIIYKDKPSETTITANQYQTEIESNNALAKLNITTTGELLDINGVITYPEIKETITITKTVESNGFYIYGASALNNFNPEIGLMYQYKKFIVGGGVSYDNYTKTTNGKLTIAYKL